ncbi:Rpn family recombination-promoting nuclease/putative transposase [Desulfococcaceae bacterium HSG8]|nr:Rpn family recombination-promoting nuclease/putative transposase [Desulfococcaceae bacterium HSG8]
MKETDNTENNTEEEEKKKSEITTPHDAGFKSAFQKKELARDFFQNYLPGNVVRNMDLSHLELVNKSYVDEQLKEKHSDIVYKTKIRGKAAFLYILFEHQSKSDFRMAFRLLCYMINIWKEYIDQNPEAKKLPPIIPVLFYHGRTGWTAAESFVSLIEDGELFLNYIPELVNLGKYDDEELIGDLALKLVLRVFKHIYDEDAGAVWQLAGDLLIKLRENPSFPGLLEWALRYFYHARTEDKEDLEKIIDSEIRKLKDKGAKEMAVSVAEQFKTEGKIEGKIEGKKETAFNLLKMGMDVKFVMRATGLSEEEVRQLKEASTDRAA